jgi:integrase
LDEKDDRLAGRIPRGKSEGLTVEELADHFLSAKEPLIASGELTQRMYDEYFATCERVVKAFSPRRLVEDLRPENFDKFRASATKKWGLHRVAGEVQRVRTLFKYGFDAGKIDRPVKFGPLFKKPSKATFRKSKAAKGESMLGAAEIGSLLHAAGPQLRAMILLGINCGFGNADCGQLTFRALDLDAGWLRFARGKTGIDRRCHLWPETVAALRVAISERPQPKDDAHSQLLFITKYGKSWFKDTPDNPVSWEFRKLLNELNLHTTDGKGFYWLRHTFETIGGESKDQVAVDAMMGHVDESMAASYRERIDDARLMAVSWHVRGFLFPTA